ncbi:MAG: tripartite tricarboxylate transporter TctB family protein [Lachnospiraceae bacterium]
MKVKYRSNLVAGIVSVILGIICMVIIPGQIGEDYSATYGITSRTVPYAVAILWIICGSILMVQSLILKKDEVKVLDVSKEAKALLYMLVLLIYAVLFQKSFLVSTMFLGVATLAFTGSKKKSFYLIVLAVVAVLYLLFAKVLHVQLP